MISRVLMMLALLMVVPSSSFASQVEPVSDPCALTGRLLGVRSEIMRLGREAYDVGYVSARLHHTSRWRPYRQVEKEWHDIHASVLSELTELSDYPIALDDLPDSRKKEAAMELITTYQEVLEQFIDYTSVAVYVERTNNDLSNNVQSQYLAFGVSKMEVPSIYATIALNHFLAQFGTADNAIRSMRTPERHYSTLCHVTFRR